MKIFIVLMAFVALAVDAQLEPDPFTRFISNYYNRRQSSQINYQPYVPYQNTKRTRRPLYIPVVTTPAPTTLVSYKSSSVSPQPYNPYITTAKTPIPYTYFSTTQVPSTVQPYSSPFVVRQSYKPYQAFTATRRPLILRVTTPTPVTVSNRVTKFNTISTPNSHQYVSVVTTPAPTRVPLYKAPTPVSQSYRPYHTSGITSRPYVPIVTTPVPTTVPLYSTPSKNPFQISTSTFRPFIPIAPSTLQPFIPPSYVSPTSVHFRGDDRLAKTRRSENKINANGSYNWFIETDNGIAAQAQGTPKNYGGDPPFVGENVNGAFSWTAPNGEFIDFTYTADENGYHPKSNAIPTPPPLPPHVVRLLEYLNRVAGTKK